MTGLDNREVFDHIYNTELDHYGSWENASKTFIVYTVNGGSCATIQNSYQKHAEIMLFDHLSKSASEIEGPICVEVYMNNSPCKDCALVLLNFLGTHRQAEITLHFANLYDIRRRSCIEKNDEHWLSVKKSDSESNADGLRMLMDHKRCKLQPFNQSAWEELLRILNIPFPVFYEEYKTCKTESDRSREMEDSLLKEDLGYIEWQDLCKKEVFYQMFSLEPDMGLVYSILDLRNRKNSAHFLPRIFNGELNEEDVMKDFFQGIEKEYCLKNQAEELVVNVYMSFNAYRCSKFVPKLTCFLWKYRKAFIEIHAAKLDRFDMNPNAYCDLKKLMDHKRCHLKGFETSTWKFLLDILGLKIDEPGFDQEYSREVAINGISRSRFQEDDDIRRALENICHQHQ